MTGLRVTVVGGGIGGMATALALRQAGLDAHVHEQAHELSEVGAGVTIQQNALRVLDSLGVGDRVRAAGAEQADYRMLRTDGAEVTREQHVGLGLHRADLLDILVRELPPEAIHLRRRLSEVHQDSGGVTAVFTDGTSVTSDVLVGADGIHSTVQGAVVDDAPEPEFSGTVLYRGLTPRENVPGWPDGAVRVWLSDDRGARIYPVRRGELINFVFFVPTGERLRESWSALGDPAALRAGFTGWADELDTVLDGIETTFVWALYDRTPLARWSRGRVTLLGDAAHAMLPTLGQGANSAIEDALALATLLRGTASEDVPEMLVRYQALRHGRTARLQRTSRNVNRRTRHLDDPDLAGVSMTLGQSWIYDYDVEQAARLARV